MNWKPLLLILATLSCQEKITQIEETPPDPTVHTWFEDVPDSLLYYPADIYEGFNAYALQEPADTTFWRLEAKLLLGEWVLLKEDKKDPGMKAGHRWYAERNKGMTFRLIAWGPSAKPDTAIRVQEIAFTY